MRRSGEGWQMAAAQGVHACTALGRECGGPFAEGLVQAPPVGEGRGWGGDWRPSAKGVHDAPPWGQEVQAAVGFTTSLVKGLSTLVGGARGDQQNAPVKHWHIWPLLHLSWWVAQRFCIACMRLSLPTPILSLHSSLYT